jgi:hypothetical protein
MLHLTSGTPRPPCTGEMGKSQTEHCIDRRHGSRRKRCTQALWCPSYLQTWSPSATSVGTIRAQGLVIPSELGEKNESQHTMACASVPTGCDSQLSAAGQTVHSWTQHLDRGGLTRRFIQPSHYWAHLAADHTSPYPTPVQ